MEGNKTLGQQIGTVKHNLSITNNQDKKVDNITVYIDYSTATDVDIKSWLNSNRVIAGQRPWRALSEDEIRELDGMTFNATTIGTKVKSVAETTQALLSTFNGKSKDEIVDTLLKTPGMTAEKAEMLAEAMLMK